MRAARRRLIVTVVGLVLIALVVAGVVVSGSRRTTVKTVTAACSTTSVSNAVTRHTRPAPTSTTPTTRPVTTTTMPARVLGPGATGREVATLQHKLLDLKFWLDDDAGVYGLTTMHAVVAFQKANGLQRDGVVGPLTRAALRAPARVVPQSTSDHVFEIDLVHQLLFDVRDGKLTWVFDTSTGAIPGKTPIGRWTVYRQVDAWVYGELGALYRPKYFIGRVAIHGNPSVPPYPASHGCVRVINPAMDWIWAHDELPIGTSVWVY